MNRIVSFIKKHKIITTFAVIVIIGGAWWAWMNFSPKPLGDKMEYLGKKDYGNILGFDSRSYSVYYYGTDMDEEELAGYFDAKYTPLESMAFKNARFVVDEKEFLFTYQQREDFFKTSKKYIVTLNGSKYPLAKASLRH